MLIKFLRVEFHKIIVFYSMKLPVSDQTVGNGDNKSIVYLNYYTDKNSTRLA